MKTFRVLLLTAVTIGSLAMYSCSDPYEEITRQDVEEQTDPAGGNGEDAHRD